MDPRTTQKLTRKTTEILLVINANRDTYHIIYLQMSWTRCLWVSLNLNFPTLPNSLCPKGRPRLKEWTQMGRGGRKQYLELPWIISFLSIPWEMEYPRVHCGNSFFFFKPQRTLKFKVCRPGWTQTKKSASLCLLIAGIRSKRHHLAWL